jgi:integrase
MRSSSVSRRRRAGNRIHYDSTVKGFGCRVTTAGARAFVLSYRTNAGRDRRYTIGAFPDWTTAAARAEAKRLKLAIRVNGADPVGGLEAARGEKTVGDLIERYIEEHLPKKRRGSQAEDLGLIRQWLIPLRHLRVAAVTIEDIDNLHRKITRTGTPYRANRVLALLSKMFALASTRWRWRPDNPCRGVERNQEIKRVRYLTAAELERLTVVLATYPDRQAANIVRMLLFTGARKSEVLAARWEDFDLELGVWTKPGASTKQKTEHRVPLSAPARQVLAEISRSRENSPETDFVFPGPRGADHRVDLKGPGRQCARLLALRALASMT